MKSFLIKLLFIVSLLFNCVLIHAAVESNYSFINPNQEQRFQHLIGELRCLVCQNQSLAESNAPLAVDLKRIVSQQINAGLTDEQIKQYLVQRYGDYILFRPNVDRVTFILWLGPLIFLVGAFIIMFLSIKRQNYRAEAQNEKLSMASQK